MPFLLKCQSTAAGRHMVKCRVPGVVLIVHAADPPAIQAPPFPIGSTGRNHVGAVTDIGASLAAKCFKGRRAADPATGAEVPAGTPAGMRDGAPSRRRVQAG